MIFFFIWIQFLFVDEPGLAVQKAYENEYPQSTKNRYLHFLKDGVSIIAEAVDRGALRHTFHASSN